MSVVIKTIRGRAYAYSAYRTGSKVAQKYLGPLADQRVAARVAALSAEREVPEHARGLFWDADPAKLDLRRHARYVIERVLELGDLAAVAWIQNIYPTRRILETCSVSRKISGKSKAFWNIWFDAP